MDARCAAGHPCRVLAGMFTDARVPLEYFSTNIGSASPLIAWSFNSVVQAPPSGSLFAVPDSCDAVCDSSPCQFFRKALGEGVRDTEDFMHKMHF